MGISANLGHKTDLESGLIYMRARYYEPSSGRFISEDPARMDGNWYAYCNGRPTDYVDASGKVAGPLVAILAALLFIGAYAVDEWMGHVLGVLYRQQDDPTFAGVETSVVINQLLKQAGFAALPVVPVAVFGPSTYGYTTGLAAKFGIGGAIGLIIGAYVGFYKATLDFTEWEESQC